MTGVEWPPPSRLWRSRRPVYWESWELSSPAVRASGVFTVSPALPALLQRPSLSAVSRQTRQPLLVTDTRNQHDPRKMRLRIHTLALTIRIYFLLCWWNSIIKGDDKAFRASGVVPYCHPLGGRYGVTNVWISNLTPTYHSRLSMINIAANFKHFQVWHVLCTAQRSLI